MASPAFQFYPGDWRRDLALRRCSLRTRGLWIECMCLMHEGIPYGHLATADGPILESRELARLIGSTAGEVTAALRELEAGRIFSRTQAGVIYSRRMVRDEALRRQRAEGGVLGAEHGVKGAEYGKLGGRPRKPSSKGGFMGVTENPPLPSSVFSLQSSPPGPPSEDAPPRGGTTPIQGGSDRPEPRVRAVPKPVSRRPRIRYGRGSLPIRAPIRPIVDAWVAGFTGRFRVAPGDPKPWDLDAAEDLLAKHGLPLVLEILEGAFRVGTQRMRTRERWSLQAIADEWETLVAMRAKGDLA